MACAGADGGCAIDGAGALWRCVAGGAGVTWGCAAGGPGAAWGWAAGGAGAPAGRPFGRADTPCAFAGAPGAAALPCSRGWAGRTGGAGPGTCFAHGAGSAGPAVTLGLEELAP